MPQFPKLASGPMFIVIKTLQYNKGVSTKFIWKSIQDKGLTDEIPSLTNLKQRVIKPMLNMRLIQKTKDVNKEVGDFNGWELHERYAIRRLHPYYRKTPF
mmetsp:Transcript_31884/g.54921  ORF Transcript_31884/g.54921 Transcript_31884/m.54921 type:complete len:100 (+) Transcript_31884:2178-2477(+)